jgi:hypothetical protein
MMTEDKKNEQDELDVCTRAPEYAEHARPNEPAEDACDDGRRGTKSQQKKEVNPMTDDKNKDCEDRVEERKKERQETMDKMSIDTSEAHTYDKSKSDDNEKCS